MNKNIRGFTIVELMIVTAIISILASIAYPSYVEHLHKGRRVIAQGELLSFANALEQYYVQNGSNYLVGGVANAIPNVYPSTITIDNIAMYDIAVTSITASTYTIKATPRSSTPIYGNGYMTINSVGARVWDKPSGLINSWE